ncbi:hypothetical protein CB1_000385032 [Camelus ferus]|nr:hypothetical protein CB1_000385032 [Camelus ferus]
MRLTSRTSVRSSTSSVKPRPAAALLQPRTRTRNNVMVDRHGGGQPHTDALVYSLRNKAPQEGVFLHPWSVLLLLVSQSLAVTSKHQPLFQQGPGLVPTGAVMNETLVTEFLIQGLSETPGLRMLLFPAFLLLYTAALLGNLLIVVLINSSPALHTPMYFFLVNLAVVDILCTSTILPKLLAGMVASKTISYGGCTAHLPGQPGRGGHSLHLHDPT